MASLGAVYVLTCIALLFLDHHHLLDPIKRVADNPLRATSARFTDGGLALEDVVHRIDGSRDVRADNARLRAENDRLVALEVRAKELAYANDQLHSLPTVAQQYPQYRLVPAAVITRNPLDTEKSFTINRGTSDGLAYGRHCAGSSSC